MVWWHVKVVFWGFQSIVAYFSGEDNFAVLYRGTDAGFFVQSVAGGGGVSPLQFEVAGKP